MIATFFPLKKLRRNGRYLLFGAILLVGAVAVYHEMVAAKAWSDGTGMYPDIDGSSRRRAMSDERVKWDHQFDSVEDSAAWSSSYIPQAWKPEYKGQANLHVFEDWCGSSTAGLRKNLHYPLYPHSRTTVQKLAVSPQWTNYGLRIFGYLHPYTDGEFVFALSSMDNSEFWLSTDDSPLNLKLLAWVGKTGTEWTAPGEFEKYASQTSRSVRLSAQRRYFFEVIHKQNDRGTDHVEVAWQLLDEGFRFMVIESEHISLYVNESTLLMSDVVHIPQTAASHQHTPTKQNSATIDMLMEDPRDTLYQVPLINKKFLHNILPDCLYKPTYTVKDFPLLRYQGLQFVHLSYIYPNDYTRLTHMETENSCFYPESPHFIKMFGFSRYMRLDSSDAQERGKAARDFGLEEYEFDSEAYPSENGAKLDQQDDNSLFPDYGDDYDDYALKRRRKLFSLVIEETNNTLKNSSDANQHIDMMQRQRKDNIPQTQADIHKPVEPLQSVPTQGSKYHLNVKQNQTELKLKGPVKKVDQIKPKGKIKPAKRQKLKSVKTAERQTNPPIPVNREQPGEKDPPVIPSEKLSYKQQHIQRSREMNHTQIQRLKNLQLQHLKRDALMPKQRYANGEMELQQTTKKHSTTPKRDINRPFVRLNQGDTDTRKSLREKEIEMNVPLQQNIENGIHGAKIHKIIKKRVNMNDKEDQVWEEEKIHNRAESRRNNREGDRDSLWGPGGNFEGADDEDLTPAPVFDTEVKRFTLVRVVNVEKRVDRYQGSRYFLELVLKDVNGQLLRLSHYIYALIRHSRQRSRGIQRPKPQMVLCNPVGFRWNPVATVHFIVPVKNQARWVQQLISDMEEMFRVTRDANFNLIITDYNSTDMDVRKALQKSSLPRYQYLKLSGNFERSAGLQAGVSLINDNHSIVFLCDLHIRFPPSIIETIREHCVEGYMAFAPIVMRLHCGSTPSEARGYWEVNGFGLLGIYKSDLDAVGGMNTEEFKDRWGGEDWELLDRLIVSPYSSTLLKAAKSNSRETDRDRDELEGITD
ncbi:hypothetical protein PAMP_019672 [Pampus punctatissimus]